MACRLDNPKCFIKKARKRKEPFQKEGLYKTGIDFDQCSFCYYREFGYNRGLLSRMRKWLPDTPEELLLLKGLIMNLSISTEPSLITGLWGNTLMAVAFLFSSIAIGVTLVSGRFTQISYRGILLLLAAITGVFVLVYLSFLSSQRKSVSEKCAQKEYLYIYLGLVEAKLKNSIVE